MIPPPSHRQEQQRKSVRGWNVAWLRRMMPGLIPILLAAIPICLAIAMPEWFGLEVAKTPALDPLPAAGISLMHREKGYFIGQVEEGSLAAHTELATGDQIIAINHVDIETALAERPRQFGCLTQIDYVADGVRHVVQIDQCER